MTIWKLWIVAITVIFTTGVLAQSASNEITRLPVITVIAEKEPAAAQSIPVSVTPVAQETLRDSDVRLVKDAAVCAPNAFMADFGPPKLSNPYFRGVGGTPLNPGVTTYIDGVPQLNGNSASIQLIDVDQIEFVRGPQGALFGRNTVGGLINITSRQPSDTWLAEAQGSYGNYNAGEGNFRISGPILKDQLGLSLSGGYLGRDGYTINSLTGHRLDGRNDYFGKVQLLWQLSDQFEVRLILSGEHDNDGDYALGELTSLRQHPFTVVRDFEGDTRRDVVAPTLLLRYRGDAVELTSISGGVWWQTRDLTSGGYTTNTLFGLSYGSELKTERQAQFSQEFRIASPKGQPVQLNNNLTLGWQAGVFMFTEDYDSDKKYDSPLLAAENAVTRLQTTGVGVYGQTKLTAWEKLDFITGLRFDYENVGGNVTPAAPPTQSFGKDFNEVTPQFGLSYRLTPTAMAYGSITRGYKAGGINTAIVPAGNSQTFGAEHSWNYEVGTKTEWLDRRLQVNLALFYIDWQQLQLAQYSGSYYIANAGAAMSKGAELELRYRPVSNWDLFASAGVADARFLSGSTAMVGLSSQSVGGNHLPYVPEFTVNAGTQYKWDLCKAGAIYARAEADVTGNFQYDAGNQFDQSSYNLASFRFGWRAKNWFAESWIKNAFDTHYIPVAFYYGTTPSGYVGESGAPVTFGLRAGLNF